MCNHEHGVLVASGVDRHGEWQSLECEGCGKTWVERRNTMPMAPLAVSCEAGNYRIYFTAESEIKKPKYAYTVSGNNVDGYIITETLIA